MKVLYVYRNQQMGYSIRRVFSVIETEMAKYCEVSHLFLPCTNYSFVSMYRNIRYALHEIKVERYDIIHITGTEHYLLPFIRRYNTIITVHDLGFYTQQKSFLKRLKKYFLWIKTLKFAKRVSFVSEKSEAEALRFVRFKKRQILTIYNPYAPTYKGISPKFFNIECPIILHIGTSENKNLKNVIAAIRGVPCELRIIGRLTKEICMQLESSFIKYSNSYDLSDEEIREEYVNCDIVSFPSLYEGFGMPIIEGQAIGRVVLTSNLSPMKEIAGGASVLVDPESVPSIRNGFIRAIENSQQYIKLGFNNIKRFSVEEITSQYYQVYKEMLEIKNH
ncbi:MAG: glycosyltransferase [Prevotella sp.]|jgi:glycosyltransferase involved in cell wall biosynthesis|nr:glycosyltransferase [Prevotella sp.]MCI1281502.1 glycosyltransferase [Prevotella sp.]